MATESPPAAPSNFTDDNDKPQTLASKLALPATGDKQEAKETVVKESFTPSVFVNSEPIREEQVQNAVKFLSHPKVKGSPVMYRRSFLEKKGLTKEEIDEAFRRFPDPPSNDTSLQATNTHQQEQLKPSSNAQPQALKQNTQTIAPVSRISHYRFHWYHAFVAAGFIVASGAGTVMLIKKTIIPRFKSWIIKVVFEEENQSGRKIESKLSVAEEAVAAAKAAAAAAVDAAKSSQEMLTSKNAEKRYFEEIMNLLGAQVQEMKSMSSTIQKLEGESSTYGRNPLFEQDFQRESISSVKPMANGHLVADTQFGSKSSNIRDSNYMPPYLNQQSSNPRLESRPKPWEVNQAQSISSHIHQPQSSSEGMNSNVNYSEYIQPQRQTKNPRITEISSEDDPNTQSYAAPNEIPAKRMWVPPQPPSVVMAEAAAAIRRPKPAYRKEERADDELSSHSSNGNIDELQRIQKLSETGGVEVTSGEVSEMSSIEIQEEEL